MVKNPVPFAATPALGLTAPPRPRSSLTQHFRTFLAIWLLPPTDCICFLCVCLRCTTEKIELPNSTSTEVEMTPPSDASEPVQNGNLSHTIEAAEAQVRPFPLLFRATAPLDVLTQQHRPSVLLGGHVPARQTPGRVSSLCVCCSVPAKGPVCVEFFV